MGIVGSVREGRAKYTNLLHTPVLAALFIFSALRRRRLQFVLTELSAQPVYYRQDAPVA